MLALTTRPLTAAERAELEARREALVAKYSDDDESQKRARDGAAWAMLWLVVVFGLIAVFNIHAGQLDAALVAGIVAVFMGIVVIQRLDTAPLSLLDRPPIMRIEQLLDADQVRVIDIHADAAVALHGIDDDDDDGPGIAGYLLRTGVDQVIYVSRDLCADVDRERLPNTKLRITCSDNLELVRVEALGQRCEPLAIVEDHSSESLLRSSLALIVWTPSEDRFALLELGSGELTPYAVELALDFRPLTTALVSRIYR